MNNPPINNKLNKLREVILGCRSSVRDWSNHKKSLIKWMFSLLDTDSLYKLKHYLEEENKCKGGRLFKVPYVLINFLAKINSIYYIPFRSLESILKILSGIVSECTPLHFHYLENKWKKV